MSHPSPSSSPRSNASSISTAASGSKTSSAPPPSSGNSISHGTLAGGIVGALIGGALIGFLLTFFIMSTRHKRNGHRTSSRLEKRSTLPKKTDGQAESSATPLVDPRHAWELHLPQSVDDMTLRQTVKTMYDHLELHIENFYSNSSPPGSKLSVDKAKWNASVGEIETPYLPASAALLLERAQVTTAVMKHCLFYLVVSSISVKNDYAFSLLPKELTGVARAASKGDLNKPVMSEALVRHAQLTGYLLSPIAMTLPSFPAERDTTIASAVTVICTAFAPWALSSSSMDTRKDNLMRILRDASEAGFMLCTQPFPLIWRWPELSRDSRQIAISPAFVRVTGGDSRDQRRQKYVEIVSARLSDL